MSYIRFGLMILTSTVAMFGLMYLNTYALEHVYFSETRLYMALVMGATMAVIMLGFMLGMYKNMQINIAIFLGAVAVFALALWLVRSQATISGESYMRAMIPHHSIAIMTSERAQIQDPRVRKLADEIASAQRREIGEMAYLIGEVSEGRTVEEIYRDPPAEAGSVQAALDNTLIAELDLAPMSAAEADQVLDAGGRCQFYRSLNTDPVFWSARDGERGALKLNGVIVPLEHTGTSSNNRSFGAPGISVSVRTLGTEADWRADAELVFALDQGLTVGYRGFYRCDG